MIVGISTVKMTETKYVKCELESGKVTVVPGIRPGVTGNGI